MTQSKIANLNTLQYKHDQQQLQSLRVQVVLWLVVLAVGIMLIPLLLVTRWVSEDVTYLERELLGVKNALQVATTPSEEVMNLNGEIARIGDLVTSMQTATVPSSVNWPRVVNVIRQYDPTTIQITSLIQNEDKIQLSGRATSNDAVVSYQQQVLASSLFRDVIVVLLSTEPPASVPAPNNRNSNATPTPVVQPFGAVIFTIDFVLGVNEP